MGVIGFELRNTIFFAHTQFLCSIMQDLAYGDTWNMRWQRIVLLPWHQIPLLRQHTTGLIKK